MSGKTHYKIRLCNLFYFCILSMQWLILTQITRISQRTASLKSRSFRLCRVLTFRRYIQAIAMYEFAIREFRGQKIRKWYVFFVEHESHESHECCASFHSRVSALPNVFIPEVHTSDSDVCSVKSAKSAWDKRLIIWEENMVMTLWGYSAYTLSLGQIIVLSQKNISKCRILQKLVSIALGMCLISTKILPKILPKLMLFPAWCLLCGDVRESGIHVSGMASWSCIWKNNTQ